MRLLKNIERKHKQKSMKENQFKMTQFRFKRLALALGIVVYSTLTYSISTFATDAPQKAAPKSAESKPVEVKADEIKSLELTPEVIYNYLLAEIAAQRGAFGISSHLFYDLAKSTRNPSLAERAAKTAAMGNQGNQALNATKLWAELDPSSVEAEQASSQLLIASGNLEEAKPHVQKLLVKEDTRAAGFLALNSLFSHQPDKKIVLSVIIDLAKPYPNLAEAHFAIAHAALSANNLELMESELTITDKLRPGWNYPP